MLSNSTTNPMQNSMSSANLDAEIAQITNSMYRNAKVSDFNAFYKSYMPMNSYEDMNGDMCDENGDEIAPQNDTEPPNTAMGQNLDNSSGIGASLNSSDSMSSSLNAQFTPNMHSSDSVSSTQSRPNTPCSTSNESLSSASKININAPVFNMNQAATTSDFMDNLAAFKASLNHGQFNSFDFLNKIALAANSNDRKMSDGAFLSQSKPTKSPSGTLAQKGSKLLEPDFDPFNDYTGIDRAAPNVPFKTKESNEPLLGAYLPPGLSPNINSLLSGMNAKAMNNKAMLDNFDFATASKFNNMPSFSSLAEMNQLNGANKSMFNTSTPMCAANMQFNFGANNSSSPSMTKSSKMPSSYALNAKMSQDSPSNK